MEHAAPESSVRALAALLRGRPFLALSGAGLSTESGIPDFRSPGGVWERFRPIEYQEFLASHEARKEHWRYKQATVPAMLAADPNTAQPLPPHAAKVTTYEGERIAVAAATPMNALLVLGEKYYRGWKATVDGKPAEIQPVDHILRGVYLTPGEHKVEFVFDPLPFKIGMWLTLASFAFYAVVLGREVWINRKERREA